MSDEPSVAEAAEELALVLTSHGLQRMTSRVLAALLFTSAPTMTAADLAAQLQASAGAISGAIKMLVAVGLAERVPAPGSRRDHYRLRDDAWTVLYTTQNQILAAIRQAASDGITATTPDGPAHRRLAEMRDFYDFMLAEIPDLLDRWRSQRRNTATHST
jgi:DNA-binding transcriptional regulator GbsR (MarR family)